MNATPSDNFGGLRYLLLNEVFSLSHLVIVKLLGIEFASVQIVFIRCLSSAVVLAPLLAWQGSLGEIRAQLGLNSLRVLLSSVAITINFFSISQIQLTQMSTIGYLRPAVTSLIAYFFLKESQSWHRWLVILIGFAAVLFIFSPESSHLQIIALLALGGLCCGSAATILQKYLSREMSDIPLMVWYSVGVAIVTAPFALWLWTLPSLTELLMMVMTGLLATTAQFFFIRAFRRAEASFLAPMFYFHIIPTTLIGFFVFSEIPSLNTVGGALTILATLIGMTLLERRR
ncbi:MAG: DMT family transporter [Rhodobacteraceae bacterium]|jgi:drug/metabolite transporter (DMT)-like permease|nr:DMT family transporter [Paracoccaceae bacterium]